VSFSERAVEAIKGRKSRVPSWFLDLNLVMAYWGGEGTRVYHHTAPVNALYGLHEALVMLEEEGLENAWSRHAREHAALRAGVEAIGLRFLVDEKWRLPQLNSIVVPDGVAEADVRRALLAEFDLEIGAGLGALAGKVWRVGLMGHGASRRNVLYFLGAMEALLGRSGAVAAAR
jgi:alanine-glyoxylate transaminase/serine-glyoxylate transaminase/serine-pyruvate transaminase